ncbi:MAG TPA: metalloregulator ArsR/SmtB family transcription factor [Planctomycetota bacterium]|nr:metalloregulator ArsR/SmtB family transcription factor [Planctomycetota bacterium]
MKKRKSAHSVEPDLSSHATLARLDRVIDALNHPVRRQILMALCFRKTMYAGEIASNYSCAWPTISRHLKVLAKAQVIFVKKKGRQVIYALNRKQVLSVWEDWLHYFAEERK